MGEIAPSDCAESADCWSSTHSVAFTNVGVLLIIILVEVGRFWLPSPYRCDSCPSRALRAGLWRTRLRSVFDALVFFFLSCFGFSLRHTTIMPGMSPISCCLFAIFESALLFTFALSAKLLLVGAGVARTGSFCRGFFDLFRRVFIADRNVVMVLIFLPCLVSVPAPTFSTCAAYVAIAYIWQFWLLRDFAATFRMFYSKIMAQLTGARPEELRRLPHFRQSKRYIEPIEKRD
jgi:hypothetical protein